MGSFYYEWEIDKLPWDAVTSVPVGGQHPDILDAKLMEAIDKRALPAPSEENSKARNAAWTFLYLYMIMALEGARYFASRVLLVQNYRSNSTVLMSDPHFTFPHVALFPSAQD